jgi:hypothetical protein
VTLTALVGALTVAGGPGWQGQVREFEQGNRQPSGLVDDRHHSRDITVGTSPNVNA